MGPMYIETPSLYIYRVIRKTRAVTGVPCILRHHIYIYIYTEQSEKLGSHMGPMYIETPCITYFELFMMEESLYYDSVDTDPNGLSNYQFHTCSIFRLSRIHAVLSYTVGWSHHVKGVLVWETFREKQISLYCFLCVLFLAVDEPCELW